MTSVSEPMRDRLLLHEDYDSIVQEAGRERRAALKEDRPFR
jgi:hypothetical protein